MMKIEDDLTPEQQAELGDLTPLYDRLGQYVVPEPDTVELFKTLQSQLPTITPVSQPSFKDWIDLIWMEAKLFEWHFWLSSVVVALVGTFWGIGNDGNGTALALLFISPLIALTGVAYIFRPSTRTLWEMEQFSHYKPIDLLYARMIVILLLNISLAGVLLLTAWTQGLQMVLWRLLLIWFGPMVGLMGLALFCSLRWGMVASWFVPLLMWGLIIMVGWREMLIDRMPEGALVDRLVRYVETSNSLAGVACMALIIGVSLFYVSSRQMMEVEMIWDS